MAFKMIGLLCFSLLVTNVAGGQFGDSTITTDVDEGSRPIDPSWLGSFPDVPPCQYDPEYKHTEGCRKKCKPGEDCPPCGCDECYPMKGPDYKRGSCYRKNPPYSDCDCSYCSALVCTDCSCRQCACHCGGTTAMVAVSASTAAVASTFVIELASAVADIAGIATASDKLAINASVQVTKTVKLEKSIHKKVYKSSKAIATAVKQGKCACNHLSLAEAYGHAAACAKASARASAYAFAGAKAWASARASALAIAEAAAEAHAHSHACAHAWVFAQANSYAYAEIMLDANCTHSLAQAKVVAKSNAVIVAEATACAVASVEIYVHAGVYLEVAVNATAQCYVYAAIMVKIRTVVKACASASAKAIALCTDDCEYTTIDCPLKQCMFWDIELDFIDHYSKTLNKIEAGSDI